MHFLPSVHIAPSLRSKDILIERHLSMSSQIVSSSSQTGWVLVLWVLALGAHRQTTLAHKISPCHFPSKTDTSVPLFMPLTLSYTWIFFKYSKATCHNPIHLWYEEADSDSLLCMGPWAGLNTIMTAALAWKDSLSQSTAAFCTPSIYTCH